MKCFSELSAFQMAYLFSAWIVCQVIGDLIGNQIRAWRASRRDGWRPKDDWWYKP